MIFVGYGDTRIVIGGSNIRIVVIQGFNIECFKPEVGTTPMLLAAVIR